MIYFLRAEQDSGEIKAGYVKIGTTEAMSVRLKQIAADVGHMPAILGVLDGSYAEEEALHERYADYRRVGEWFDPSESDMLSMVGFECRRWDESEAHKPVRLDLPLDSHKRLRLLAADAGMSMTAYAKAALTRMVIDEAKARGLIAAR